MQDAAAFLTCVAFVVIYSSSWAYTFPLHDFHSLKAPGAVTTTWHSLATGHRQIRSGLPLSLQSSNFVEHDSDEYFLEQVLEEIGEEDEEDWLESGEERSSSPDLNATIQINDWTSLLSSNLSYFYLKNELGLSELALWKITYEAGSVLSMSSDTVRKKISVLNNTMNLSSDDVCSILERHPTILHLSADKNLSPTVLFLVRALDLGKEDLRTLVLGCPSLLSYTTANLRAKLRFFTVLMEYSVVECRKLLLSEPRLLRAGVRSGLVSRLRFLTREIELPLPVVREVVQKNPRILLYSLEKSLMPKLVFFCIMTLHMEPTNHLQRLLKSYPQFLDYNLEDHIMPIIRFFTSDLEFASNEVRGILMKFPRLVTHSLVKIKHTVGLLRFELGLSGDDVKRVLYQAPQVVGLKDELILQKLEFLRTNLRLSDQELRRILTGMPTVLLLSLESNLVPKVNFLQEILPNPKEAILRLPTLLGYSLESRIKPRLEKIVQVDGLDPASITVGIPMKHDNFCKWLERRKKKIDRIKNEENEQRRRDLFVSKPSEDDGRIVHWSRERRPPPTKP